MPARIGVEHHKAKLCEADIHYIRDRRADGATGFQIVEELDHKVAESTVWAVIKGHTWRHVE